MSCNERPMAENHDSIRFFTLAQFWTENSDKVQDVRVGTKWVPTYNLFKWSYNPTSYKLCTIKLNTFSNCVWTMQTKCHRFP